MLLIFTGVLYASLVCWSWGVIAYKCIRSPVEDKNIPIICITGLAVLAPVLSIISIRFPIHSLPVHSFIFLPVLFIAFKKNTRNFFQSLIKNVSSFSLEGKILAAISVVAVLVLSTYEIEHPDTLEYHAEIIRWSMDYRAIPGLGNLQDRLSFQSSWFILCSVFNFKLLTTEPNTYLNYTVVIWYILFITERISFNCSKKNPMAIGWILLLVISFWHYPMIRLTVASYSPDFPAAILVLLVFHLFITRALTPAVILQLVLQIFTAITIKVSVIFLVLLASLIIFKLIYYRRFKFAVICLALIAAIMIPSISRNFISSGYLLYPVKETKMNVEWALPEKVAENRSNAISAYCRIPRPNLDSASAEKIMSTPFKEWVPEWWSYKSTPDKMMIILSFVCVAILPGVLYHFKAGLKQIASAGILMAAMLFWFVTAPELRFAVGFMLSLAAFLTYLIVAKIGLPKYNKAMVIGATILVSLSLTLFTVYRITNYYQTNGWLNPIGIQAVKYSTQICQGVEFYTPEKLKECGSVPFPCIYIKCSSFQLRSKELKDGFKKPE